jgi:hypothetical protein
MDGTAVARSTELQTRSISAHGLYRFIVFGMLGIGERSRGLDPRDIGRRPIGYRLLTWNGTSSSVVDSCLSSPTGVSFLGSPLLVGSGCSGNGSK